MDLQKILQICVRRFVNPHPGVLYISERSKKIMGYERVKTGTILPIQKLFIGNKHTECIKFRALRAKLKASAVHIWPADRMLCIPALNNGRS